MKLWFKMGRCYGLVLGCLVSACCMLNSFSEARSLGSVVLYDCAIFSLCFIKIIYQLVSAQEGLCFCLLRSVYIARHRFTMRKDRDL